MCCGEIIVFRCLWACSVLQVSVTFTNFLAVHVCVQFVVTCVCVRLQVQATDADQGENGRVLYRILSGNYSSCFLILHVNALIRCAPAMYYTN